MNNINNKNMKVPEGWKRVRLGEVIEEVDDKNIAKHNLPVLTSSRRGIFAQEEYFNRLVASSDLSNYNIIKKGEFTYRSMSDDQTFVFNMLEDFEIGLVSPAYYVFKTKPSCDNVFFKYFVNASNEIKLQIYKIIQGSTRTALKFNQLLEFAFSLPPFPEQQKIAEILETVDRAIEKTNKIIEKYKRIKQGLMQDLLTKGIDENGKIRSEKTHKFKNSPIGRIPEEWEVVRLGEVFRLKSGETRPYNMTDIGIYPVYGGNGIIGYSTEKNFEGKTIIIGRVGEYCGCVYIANIGWVTDNALYVVNKKTNYYDQFLYYLLTYFNLNQHSSETGQPLMTQSIINMIIIPLPPLPEQQRIAEILSQIDNTIEKEEAYKQKLERIKKGLMEDLLMGRVRVNELITM